jgi:hypothetical protein
MAMRASISKLDGSSKEIETSHTKSATSGARVAHVRCGEDAEARNLHGDGTRCDYSTYHS